MELRSLQDIYASLQDIYAIRKGKHYYCGGYDPQNKMAHVVHVDGPYNWSFILYRSYLNRVTEFIRPFASEADAIESLHAAFKHIAVDGVTLDSFLKKEWKRRKCDNLPDAKLIEIQAEIEALPDFKDITSKPTPS